MAAITLQEGSTRHRIWTYGGWAAFVLFIILVAFAYVDVGSIEIGDNSYSLSVTRLSKAIAFMVAILGLQVVVGYTGQLALGQSFFFGTGAYITAWLVQDHNWPFLATLVVVVPFCFLLGMLLGLPALRVKGLYLALVTLALAAVFPAIVQLEQLSEYTNGAGGKLIDNDLEAPSWIPFEPFAEFLQALPVVGGFFGEEGLTGREIDRLWVFTFITLVAAACFALVSNMLRSRPGRAIRAIRDNETGAAVSGVNLPLYKTLSFGVASALGGVGGMLYVTELGIASPLDFTQILAINFIVGLVVGGVGTLSGAVVGGFLIAFIPEWSSSTESVGGIPERWLQGPTGSLFLGIMLIILTFVLPGGIAQAFRRIKARYIRTIPRPPTRPGAVAKEQPVPEEEPVQEEEEVAPAGEEPVQAG
ncbi:MAG: branched-chain amino acid ABC transporter permease [Actinomycetota bacterium]